MNPPLRMRRRSAGFSLVEVMIGLLIGMIAAVVMMQVFSVSEGYKRVTTGGDDAQNTGAIALHELQYALRDSGFVAGAYNLIGCSVQIRTGVTLSAISPVTINPDGIPGGDGDTLLVVYGSSNGSAEGDVVQAQPIVPTTYAVAAAAPGATGIGSFAALDQIIAEPLPRPSPCALAMEPVTAVAGVNVSVAAGVGGMSNGALFNMGPSPHVLV
ncbi:MAG TPA: prepilin-type N-terminal cleavage/methylation domain-containing protein, partial [Albitalea sp.]|nr:prepilin-type N-terminal cleavage/methylation domain-containing protein [Albitalea sp.]